LYTRLKLNKNVVHSFVNKLNSKDIVIMNKTINEYIQYIQDNYQNANDYILQSSFNELKKNIMWKNYKKEMNK
jgi:exonuclease V gamma subunit